MNVKKKKKSLPSQTVMQPWSLRLKQTPSIFTVAPVVPSETPSVSAESEQQRKPLLARAGLKETVIPVETG